MSDDNGRIGISPEIYDEQVAILNECVATLGNVLGDLQYFSFLDGTRGSIGPVASRIVDISLEMSKCAVSMEELITASIAHVEAIRDDIVEADEIGG